MVERPSGSMLLTMMLLMLLMHGMECTEYVRTEHNQKKYDGIRKNLKLSYKEDRVYSSTHRSIYNEQNTGEKYAQNQHMIKTDDMVTETRKYPLVLWYLWQKIVGGELSCHCTNGA